MPRLAAASFMIERASSSPELTASATALAVALALPVAGLLTSLGPLLATAVRLCRKTGLLGFAGRFRGRATVGKERAYQALEQSGFVIRAVGRRRLFAGRRSGRHRGGGLDRFYHSTLAGGRRRRFSGDGFFCDLHRLGQLVAWHLSLFGCMVVADPLHVELRGFHIHVRYDHQMCTGATFDVCHVPTLFVQKI